MGKVAGIVGESELTRSSGSCRYLRLYNTSKDMSSLDACILHRRACCGIVIYYES
jgi:hypothetical protein